MDEDLPDRLEMLVVARWLDATEGDGRSLALRVDDAAVDLGLGDGRPGVLAVMAALGALEDRGAVRVSWPAGPRPGGEARVTLSEALRADARRLFGRT